MHIGYARVSTQDLRLQYDALHQAQCDKISIHITASYFCRIEDCFCKTGRAIYDCLWILMILAAHRYEQRMETRASRSD